MRAPGLWPVLLVGVAACGGGDPGGDVQVAGNAAADSVTMAAAQYDAAAFDTIQWQEPKEALDRGSLVFTYSCAKCHGSEGFGDAQFVQGGDTLTPPSFHRAGWRFADDPEGLREYVYTGSDGRMPHWGLHGLKYRDIDAVTLYILDLRKRHGAS